ncbi:MAG: DUF1499 domain-containing protein [Pseudomonas sp.]|uniref:DUF1499 domain-containing protein n=1 Tax=Pseudomonas sp. TaxID=306 RepID=UPI002716B459|nr:DUF1499 domain-containing protein [Pseudomonas sp.]MDO9616099.1 DUF1499 domain-containing protein [Pseudomonas sp.]MDP2446820.1 DUF1499 domain-containing protein [Pseudomonas sp.]
MSPASVWQNALIRATRRAHKPVLALPLLVLLSACSGTAPDNLGIHNGQLSACPDSPNCVNSQASDARHAIAPLPLKGSTEETQAHLKALLSEESRVSLVEEAPGYLRAEFSSKLMRFVDDVEFMIGASAVDVRSASRLGYADFDVNRERIERLRQRLGE